MDSSNKKQIIIIGPSYPYRGGNSLFVTKTYEVLQKDFNVKIFNYKLLYPSFLFPGTTQFDRSERKVFKVPSERIVNSISPVNWFIVAGKIKEENPDLIIFDWWHPFFGFCLGTISFLLKKEFGKRLLFITENVVSHESNKIDKILTKIGIGNASMFLALSGKVVKELQRFSQSKKIYRSELPIYDCYEANDSDTVSNLKTNLNIKEDHKVLLFFGYVRKYKGLDVLLESFPGILEKHPDTFLLVVGEFYDNPELYLDLIKKYNIGNRVRIINEFVPNEEVYKYYQVSDVVVLPYKSATQSGILNIAYGFNKPVIVTDVGGLAEFVVNGKTGIIIKPDSTREIVDGYDKFLNLQKEINFIENIKEHNTQNSFNKLPEVINQIVEEIE